MFWLFPGRFLRRNKGSLQWLSGLLWVSLLPLPRYSLRFVIWSRLRRVTFQRWKVTKDRRACGPGPRVGAKSATFRFRLKPKTTFRSFAPPSPHRTRFAGLRRGPHEGGGGIGTGLANPLVVTRRFSLRPLYFGHWPLGRISPLQNLEVVALPLAVLMPPNDGTNLYKMALGLRRRVFSSLLSDLRDYKTFCENIRLQVSLHTDSTPNPSNRRWQSERRHVDQPRQRNCLQVLQGGYPPEGPMAEVLRATSQNGG